MRRTRRHRGMGVAMLVVCWGGCAGASSPPPEWVSHLSASRQELCAIGVSGPTYYTEDARANSKALAMTELARTLEVKVTADLTLRSHGDSHGSDTTLQESAGFASEVVLTHAQVRAQWVHAGGDARYGERGTIYTLVCMPLGG